jgi:signal transduction histidine kinase
LYRRNRQKVAAYEKDLALRQITEEKEFLAIAERRQAEERLRQSSAQLQASNRSLERRVEERTAELQKALERVSELNQLKANFISNISHELRTPLTHIKGYVELLVSESLGPLTEEQKHALEVSQQSTARLEALIDDLLMVSMASRGELSLKQTPVDICRLANLTVKSHGEAALRRGVRLLAAIDERVPLVHADSQKVAWVLGQLVDNGLKFTPSGGSVTVAVKREGENLVIVSVVDTGIGIPSNRLQDIFEPFHQLDGSSTRQYNGTGLGLSLVRQIVEAHGSMLEVQSMEGRGSAFKFPLLAVMESE